MNRGLLCLALGGGALVACQAISGLNGFHQREGAGGAASAHSSSEAQSTSSSASGIGGRAQGSSVQSGISSSETGPPPPIASGPTTTMTGSSGTGSTTAIGSSGSGGAGSGGAGGGCAHWVFVSSKAFPGNFLANSEADNTCAADAMLHVKSLTPANWLAIISTSKQNAIDRIGPLQGDVCLYDGPLGTHPVVVPNGDFSKGVLQHPINTTANGDAYPGPIWTGTNTMGVSSGKTCVDWTSPSPNDNGTYGDASKTDATWIDEVDASACSNNYPVYCIGVPSKPQ